MNNDTELSKEESREDKDEEQDKDEEEDKDEEGDKDEEEDKDEQGDDDKSENTNYDNEEETRKIKEESDVVGFQERMETISEDPFEAKYPSKFSRFDKTANVIHPLDHLNKESMIQTVDDMQKQLRYLKMENIVFENFLKMNDPEAVDDLQENVDLFHEKISNTSRRSSIGARIQFRSSRQSQNIDIADRSHPASRTTEVPKINLILKTDLVLREIDEVQGKLDAMNKKWHDSKFILVSKIEELETRRSELEESMKDFEEFRQNQEQITFPKLVRFMEEWSKRSRLMVDKLRLRHSSLKVQYHKTSAILAHKKLIGENLQEIDFEQLRIENLHLVEKIDKKGLLLMELKRMTGAGNLKLSQEKKMLLQKMEEKEGLQNEIERIQKDINRSDNEIMKLYEELDQAKEEFDKIQNYTNRFVAPDVVDYVKKKVELEEMKRDMKMWTRRLKIKNAALNIVTKQLGRLLGGRKPDPSWFE